MLFNRNTYLIFFPISIIGAANETLLHSGVPIEQQASPYQLTALSEEDREKLINNSFQSCLVPCWTQSCQARYPRCPFTKYNRTYDETMHTLFPPGGPWDNTTDWHKKTGVTLFRNRYTCQNIYKFLCAVAGITQAKVFCLKHLGTICTRICCIPNMLFCSVSFWCSRAAKKCDEDLLNYLSNPAHYDIEKPEIVNITDEDSWFISDY